MRKIASPVFSSQKTRFTMIFSTCDQYSFLWDNYFLLLKKYWPEFNATIISTSSIKIENDYDIKTINKSNDSFSSRLIRALKMCDTDVILFTLDDFYFPHRVSNTFFEEALSIMLNDKEIMCINLWDIPSSNEVSCGEYNNYFVKKKNDYIFAITTQLSLWRKDYLLKILRRGEDPWSFECYSQKRQQHYKGTVLYVKDEYKHFFSYPVAGVLNKGIITKSDEVRALLIDNNIKINIPPARKTKRFNRHSKIWNFIISKYLIFYEKYNYCFRFLPYISKE